MYTAKSAGYHFHSLSVWRQGLEIGGIWGKALRIIRPVTVELFSYLVQHFLQNLSSDRITVRIFFIGPTLKHYIRFQGHTDDFHPLFLRFSIDFSGKRINTFNCDSNYALLSRDYFEILSTKKQERKFSPISTQSLFLIILKSQ